MDQMQTKYGPKGFQVVAVNVDKRREDALRFLQNRTPAITIAWDPFGTTPRAYEVKAMPTSLIIGRDGRVLHVHKGFRAQDTEVLERRVQQAVQAQD